MSSVPMSELNHDSPTKRPEGCVRQKRLSGFARKKLKAERLKNQLAAAERREELLLEQVEVLTAAIEEIKRRVKEQRRYA